MTFFTLVEELTAPELDLHGMTRDEAWLRTQDFIKENLREGRTAICLLHGRGSGSLRTMLEQKLRNHPNVEATMGLRNDAFMVRLRA